MPALVSLVPAAPDPGNPAVRKPGPAGDAAGGEGIRVPVYDANGSIAVTAQDGIPGVVAVRLVNRGELRNAPAVQSIAVRGMVGTAHSFRIQYLFVAAFSET